MGGPPLAPSKPQKRWAEDAASKTLIVLGAGASVEVGLPTGDGLKERMIPLLDIRFDFHQIAGDRLLWTAIEAFARENGIRDVNDVLRLVWHMRDALPHVLSIDNYIDQKRGDVFVEFIGKAAIARVILDAERKSMLFPDRETGLPDLSAVRKTWLNELFKLICEGCTVEDLPARMKEIGMVIFNYDRCFEHFMLHALLKVYPELHNDEAAALIKSIEIHHPYGTVGWLPWGYSGTDAPRPQFGQELGTDEFKRVAVQLKTFTESVGVADEERAKLVKLVSEAERTIFMGFAYHPLNLTVLYGKHEDLPDPTRKCYGSAFEISSQNLEAIKDELSDRGGFEPHQIHLVDMTCTNFVKAFARQFGFRRLR